MEKAQAAAEAEAMLDSWTPARQNTVAYLFQLQLWFGVLVHGRCVVAYAFQSSS